MLGVSIKKQFTDKLTTPVLPTMASTWFASAVGYDPHRWLVERSKFLSGVDSHKTDTLIRLVHVVISIPQYTAADDVR